MNIRDFLNKSEILCALAEEAAELSQAALKLRRAIDGQNPTPKTIPNCEVSLDEEIADVELCLNELGFHSEDHLLIQSEIMTAKRSRWQSRLQNARKDV